MIATIIVLLMVILGSVIDICRGLRGVTSTSTYNAVNVLIGCIIILLCWEGLMFTLGF